ncbi:MAG: protein translocase subunit SecF [Candidatus Eisenbacteria bacterium]|nr:protein translocase subunit SecF [Candidatus Eisenbacteria bacterium]
MLQILHDTNFPFMKHRRIAYAISTILLVATLGFLFTKGPRYSVDFTGGTLVQLRTTPAAHADEVREALDGAGFKGAEIQQLTNDAKDEYLIRVQSSESASAEDAKHISERMTEAITAKVAGTAVEIRRIETVGPKVGGELRTKAVMAILSSLGVILLYVGIRYEFKFAVGGVVALLHDVLVTLGFLMFTGREVSLTVVAALLTIAGYSINDTIVIFDRIRERSKALRKEQHSRMMDIAINETLSRTVITAFTVFLAALALFVWGGEVLNDFSFAMLIGTVFGTYSSVYVASAVALDLWIALDRQKGVQAE